MASLKEKIAYAMGDAAAGGIVWKVMSIAFPLFFTNVFGLSFADAAVLMLIARMFDVVTDPLMGSLADRTQSRFGTYRPWLIFGAIPFGLIFALLLYTPDFGPVGKRIYAYTLYLLMMAVYTMVNVPYGSLLGVMTEDDDEKMIPTIGMKQSTRIHAMVFSGCLLSMRTATIPPIVIAR